MDPGLVRGKKQKKEIDDDDVDSKERMMIDHQYTNENHTPLPELPKLKKLDSVKEQENLLKYRADILKYQGMYLHYQASVLEQEARNRLVEEGKPFAFVPTIRYSGYTHDDYNVADDPHHMYDLSSDVPMNLSDHAEEEVQDDYEEQIEETNDQPLDLSVKSSPNTYLHTQSTVMPRIFFSRISATN